MRFLIITIGLIIAISCSTNNTTNSSAITHALRLLPGDDLKIKLDEFVKLHNITAATIVSGIGSLTQVSIRYANQKKTTTLQGHFEILSINGTLSSLSPSHLHIAVANEKGVTIGGHLKEGNIIYTTAEIVLLEIKNIAFHRKKCSLSGYNELYIN